MTGSLNIDVGQKYLKTVQRAAYKKADDLIGAEVEVSNIEYDNKEPLDSWITVKVIKFHKKPDLLNSEHKLRAYLFEGSGYGHDYFKKST